MRPQPLTNFSLPLPLLVAHNAVYPQDATVEDQPPPIRINWAKCGALAPDLERLAVLAPVGQRASRVLRVQAFDPPFRVRLSNDAAIDKQLSRDNDNKSDDYERLSSESMVIIGDNAPELEAHCDSIDKRRSSVGHSHMSCGGHEHMSSTSNEAVIDSGNNGMTMPAAAALAASQPDMDQRMASRYGAMWFVWRE